MSTTREAPGSQGRRALTDTEPSKSIGKKWILPFLAGLAMMGMAWYMQSSSYQYEEVKPVQPVIQVTDIKTVTKEVRMPATNECVIYIDAVNKLREGQRQLSLTKGLMKIVLDDLQMNVFTDDPFVVKDLQKRMNELQQEMNNAWIKIGDASATVDKYEPGQEPCR